MADGRLGVSRGFDIGGDWCYRFRVVEVALWMGRPEVEYEA